jgi:hypothetical protein
MIETFHITVADLERTVRQRVRFEAGRAKINAKSKARLATATNAIREALDRDLIVGRPAHGRVTRIARELEMKRPTVSRILKILMCPVRGV